MPTLVRKMKPKDISRLREILAERQNNLCWICCKELVAPVLDHHHKKRVKGTGQLRGVLCRGCNILLGKMENNCVRYGISQEELPLVLRAMSEYLQKPLLPYLHPSEVDKPKKLKKSSYNTLKKAVGDDSKIPEYPKSGRLTKRLEELYNIHDMKPEYYK